MKENNYYNKKVEELYKELNTSISGLTEEEASKRLERYGENKLAERKKKSNFIIFLNQFNDLMIILLIFASVFSAVIYSKRIICRFNNNFNNRCNKCNPKFYRREESRQGNRRTK